MITERDEIMDIIRAHSYKVCATLKSIKEERHIYTIANLALHFNHDN